MSTEIGAQPRGSEAGFTLIEVLIALMILSVGLLGLEALGIGAARMVTRAERESEYLARATSRMETLVWEYRSGGTPAAGTEAITNPQGQQVAVMNWTPSVVDPTLPTLRRVKVMVTPTEHHPVLNPSDTISLSVDVFVP